MKKTVLTPRDAPRLPITLTFVLPPGIAPDGMGEVWLSGPGDAREPLGFAKRHFRVVRPLVKVAVEEADLDLWEVGVLTGHQLAEHYSAQQPSKPADVEQMRQYLYQARGLFDDAKGRLCEQHGLVLPERRVELIHTVRGRGYRLANDLEIVVLDYTAAPSATIGPAQPPSTARPVDRRSRGDGRRTDAAHP